MSDPESQIVSCASLVLSKYQVDDINSRMDKLKERVGREGINIDDPKFEFHTHEIFRGEKLWKSMEQNRRMRVLHSIKEIFPQDPMFAVIRLNKQKFATRSNNRLRRDIKQLVFQVKEQLPNEEITELEKATRHLDPKRGFGELHEITMLLFGLTSGLIHWERMEGSTETIVDSQFLKKIDGWQFVFRLNDIAWLKASSQIRIPTWPKDNQPTWRLGDKVWEKDSVSCYGLQLADYIAYTTKRLQWKRGNKALPEARQTEREMESLSFVRARKFKQMYDYRGIELYVSGKVAMARLENRPPESPYWIRKHIIQNKKKRLPR